jgi:ribosomal-protein-alanine N-acetyltransferase
VPGVVEFETERVRVCRLVRADLADLAAIFRDPAATRYYGEGRPLSAAEAEALLDVHLEYDARLLCAPGLLRLKPTGAVAGFGGIGYNPSGPVPAYLEYILTPAHWGQGLATEVARGALAAAFRHPQVREVLATVHPANAASVRVLEKCGLTYERYLPERDRRLYRAARPMPAAAHGAGAP